MNEKVLKMIGIIIAFILCFPLHFLYDKFPSFFTSIFAPVNESIWEHMKILFGSILISGFIQIIIVRVTNKKVNNILFSNFIGAVVSIPVFLVIFLPVYYIIGENFIVTIVIMFIAIVIAEIISYILMIKKDFRLESKTIFFIIIIYIVFTLLTYFPIRSSLFIDPTNLIYGINS